MGRRNSQYDRHKILARCYLDYIAVLPAQVALQGRVGLQLNTSRIQRKADVMMTLHEYQGTVGT